jgi:ParB-like chromosome segregation protein Spo0J
MRTRDGIRHANARWSGLRTVAVMTTRHRTPGDTVALDALDLRARLRPVDAAHVAVLAEVLDDTPPVLVLVDGESLRLLDGFMRVDAARRLGRSTVRVEWVRGDEAAAVERAVRANASHGLPLSRRQRREPGLRLLALAPGWSDRRIASACGVDPKSVGRWRRDAAARSGGELPHLSSEERVGRDGRRYLVGEELAARREVARQLLRDDPALSDREVGRRSGLSAGAVGRVRVDVVPDSVGGSAESRRRSPMVRRLLRSLRVVVGRVALLFGRVLRRR